MGCEVVNHWKDAFFDFALATDTSMNHNNNMKRLDHCLWVYPMAQMWQEISLFWQDFSSEKSRRVQGESTVSSLVAQPLHHHDKLLLLQKRCGWLLSPTTTACNRSCYNSATPPWASPASPKGQPKPLQLLLLPPATIGLVPAPTSLQGGVVDSGAVGTKATPS